jgi:replicative DNA helicase
VFSTNLVKKYYDKRSACQVLGILMKDPKRIKNKECILDKKDFSKGLHETIFVCIYNLACQGVKQINISEIESYLATADPLGYKKVFEVGDGIEWLNKILEDANEMNFTYYYLKVKKMALLRSYLEQGIDITNILNIDEIDPLLKQSQQEKFDNMTLNEIIKECDKKNMEAKKNFVSSENTKSRKAGDDAEELYELKKQFPSYGFGLESDYLNSITRGAQRKKVFLETRDTGMGKTRIAIKRLLNITAPYYWSFAKKTFIENPNGKDNSALYIGTEMELYEELEPMMWAFISGVDEEKINDSKLTKDEEERVKKAIEILNDTKLFLEDEANFNISYLWHIVEEYKINYDICAVALDYIELNSALVSEFTNETRGMSVREDQILLSISTNLKNIAKEFDVFINAFTQTTDEARRDGVRDQRAVKGARSLPNKVDVGIITFEPTVKELEKLEYVIKQTGIAKHKTPNVCHSFYKNRGGKIKNVRVWGYQDLGTMEFYDLFCTDNNFKRININPIKIQMINNKAITS